MLFSLHNITSASFRSQFWGISTKPLQETWVQSLGWDDPLEKGMATHFSILAWRIPQTEEPGGLQSMGSQRIRHDWVTNTNIYTL